MAQPAQIQYHPLLEELSPFVASCSIIELETKANSIHLDIFPIGCSVLTFALDDLAQNFLFDEILAPRFNLTGQLTKYQRYVVMPGYYRMLSVMFKPYGVYRFFNFSQSALINKYADMAETDAQAIYNEVYNCYSNPTLAMDLLQKWLLKRLDLKVNFEKLAIVREVVDIIDANEGKKTISELYDTLNLSKSTLERYFLEIVGLTPKMYSRIIRFNKVYQTLQHGQYDTWQEVVYQYNFYDQAHFIKDFKNFFNKTPSEVHKSRFNTAELFL